MPLLTHLLILSLNADSFFQKEADDIYITSRRSQMKGGGSILTQQLEIINKGRVDDVFIGSIARSTAKHTHQHISIHKHTCTCTYTQAFTA